MIKWKKKNFGERSQLDNIFKIQKFFDEEQNDERIRQMILMMKKIVKIMNENKIDLLKNLLSLYFNYSKDFFEEIMNYYLKPIEKNLYNLLLENFDNKLQENDYIIN